jgi:hypothetical protein
MRHRGAGPTSCALYRPDTSVKSVPGGYRSDDLGRGVRLANRSVALSTLRN